MSSIVDGVIKITVLGVPGTLHSQNGEWVHIASGYDDQSFGATFAMARTFGRGRVIALGHEGLLSDESLPNASCAIKRFGMTLERIVKVH